MEHKDIIKLVDLLEIVPLTRNNFEDFVQNARRLFTPKGAEFQSYFSPGYNINSRRIYDWTNGKPEWREGPQYVFNRIEQGENLTKARKWVNMYFKDWVEMLGTETRYSVKFAFDQEKALYLAQVRHNGGRKNPWEKLYVRLEPD